MRVFFVLIFFLMAFPSYAQEFAKVQDIPSAEPTEKQMKEARIFLEKCNLDKDKSSRHNCKCLTLQFLEKRVQKGDEAKTSEILSSLRNVCLRGDQKEMEELGYKDMSEIPQEIIDEAQNIHKACMQDFTMRTYQDCGCIAGKFIEDRMKLGPMISADAIITRYQADCKNDTELAGYQFTRCMENQAMVVPEEFKPKYYCECYASEFVKANKALTERPYADTQGHLMSIAVMRCQEKLSKDEKYRR